MKTLVISDIHLRIEKVDKILSIYEKDVDEVCFLSDWFDDFYDNPERNRKMAEWVKEKLKNPKNKIIYGNHDLHYRFPDIDFLKGSGWELEKSVAINEVLKEEDWDKFHYLYSSNGFVFTHAGIRPEFFYGVEKQKTIEEVHQDIKDSVEIFKKGLYPRMFSPGRARGGVSPYGGINWLHWSTEFQPVPGINQIVGHTPGKEPRSKITPDSINWCLDTNNDHVIVITDGVVEVRRTT